MDGEKGDDNFLKKSGNKMMNEIDKKKPQMTESQCNVIIDFMSAHPLFAANFSMGCDSQRTKDKLGDNLTNLVNSNGPVKTEKQVLDCWRYLRRKAKKYHAEKKKYYEKTGNPAAPFAIKDRYEKVLKIIGISHGCGLELVNEDGFENEKKIIEQATHGPVKVLNLSTFEGTRKRKMVSTISLESTLTKPTSTVSLTGIEQIPSSVKKTAAIESSISETPLRRITDLNINQRKDKKLPNTPENRVVCSPPRMIETEAPLAQTQYSESFKTYATMYKKKTSPAQVRSQIALNSINEGNMSIRNLAESVQKLHSTNVQRNNLFREQNDLLRRLISMQDAKVKQAQNKENKS